jgi:hypothetical protein
MSGVCGATAHVAPTIGLSGGGGGDEGFRPPSVLPGVNSLVDQLTADISTPKDDDKRTTSSLTQASEGQSLVADAGDDGDKGFRPPSVAPGNSQFGHDTAAAAHEKSDKRRNHDLPGSGDGGGGSASMTDAGAGARHARSDKTKSSKG